METLALSGGYSVSVPELPECFTEGETAVEIRRMVREAIRALARSRQYAGRNPAAGRLAVSRCCQLVHGPARGSSQKRASWSARTRAPKCDPREAPHAAPGRSPTLGPLKKGPPGPRGPTSEIPKIQRSGVPSGVPCGEGRIGDEAAGRIEGRDALVTPRNSCPSPATLHLACTPTNGVPSARPLTPNHWGEGSGSWHQSK